jgi:3-oxoacyl-[acyl-carrier-protein] synthase-1
MLGSGPTVGEDAEAQVDALPSEPADKEWAVRVFEQGATLAKTPRCPSVAFVATSGHTGTAEAIQAAIDDLTSRKIDAALVGAVDSLLGEDTLAWLEQAGRLKTPSVPVGLQPGEGAVLLVLQRQESTDSRGFRPFAGIVDVRFGEEPSTLVSGSSSRGECLLSILAPMVDNPTLDDTQPLWILTDQNGESYRAHEWGHALPRLAARAPAFMHPKLWYPAVSLGDTGAAAGAVAICIAIRAFARRYAPSVRAFVLSSSDLTRRSALLLSNLTQ